jgi:hypothetical protein
MTYESLGYYLEHQIEQVSGWCSRQIWQIILPIVDFQNSISVHNPVAEIGVLHGKFFLGLVATKNADTGNFAIDVFSMQQFNLDGAGPGNRDTLLTNARIHGFSLESLELLECDSMAIDFMQIEDMRAKSGGGFSLFSVDGCHLPEHTINDVSIAMGLTVSAGLIFVDDYTNPDWPGVVEGMAKLYLSGAPRFVPLVVAHNKLFLCHLSYHRQYLELLTDKLTRLSIHFKRVQRFGYDCLTVHLDAASKNYLGRI